MAGLTVLWSVTAGAAPVTVTVAPLDTVTIAARNSASAEVVPANSSILAAEIAAVIRSVHADVGTSVSKGDVLVKLDGSDFRLALKQSEANAESAAAEIERAKIRLQRVESLAEKQYASPDEILARTTELAVFRANEAAQRVAVEQARLNLRRTSVVAPFDGTIVHRDAQAGAYANVGTPLVTIVQTTEREVEAELYPRLIEGLQRSTAIHFENAGTKFALQLLRVSPIVDSATRMQITRLQFADETAPIGSNGTIQWTEASGLIPVHIVVQRDGKLGVFLAVDGSARFHPLPGATEGRAAPHDLPRDAMIIIQGRARLQDGMAVEIRR